MDYEAKAADQVPLLMRMKKDDLALEKAIMSGDTDLGKQTEHAHYGQAIFFVGLSLGFACFQEN